MFEGSQQIVDQRLFRPAEGGEVAWHGMRFHSVGVSMTRKTRGLSPPASPSHTELGHKAANSGTHSVLPPHRPDFGKGAASRARRLAFVHPSPHGTYGGCTRFAEGTGNPVVFWSPEKGKAAHGQHPRFVMALWADWVTEVGGGGGGMMEARKDMAAQPLPSRGEMQGENTH